MALSGNPNVCVEVIDAMIKYKVKELRGNNNPNNRLDKPPNWNKDFNFSFLYTVRAAAKSPGTNIIKSPYAGGIKNHPAHEIKNVSIKKK
jgi:hypothetical protein